MSEQTHAGSRTTLKSKIEELFKQLETFIENKGKNLCLLNCLIRQKSLPDRPYLSLALDIVKGLKVANVSEDILLLAMGSIFFNGGEFAKADTCFNLVRPQNLSTVLLEEDLVLWKCLKRPVITQKHALEHGSRADSAVQSMYAMVRGLNEWDLFDKNATLREKQEQAGAAPGADSAAGNGAAQYPSDSSVTNSTNSRDGNSTGNSTGSSSNNSRDGSSRDNSSGDGSSSDNSSGDDNNSRDNSSGDGSSSDNGSGDDNNSNNIRDRPPRDRSANNRSRNSNSNNNNNNSGRDRHSRSNDEGSQGSGSGSEGSRSEGGSSGASDHSAAYMNRSGGSGRSTNSRGSGSSTPSTSSSATGTTAPSMSTDSRGGSSSSGSGSGRSSSSESNSSISSLAIVPAYLPLAGSGDEKLIHHLLVASVRLNPRNARAVMNLIVFYLEAKFSFYSPSAAEQIFNEAAPLFAPTDVVRLWLTEQIVLKVLAVEYWFAKKVTSSFALRHNPRFNASLSREATALTKIRGLGFDEHDPKLMYAHACMLHLVRGIDNGRRAWYYVLVDPEQLRRFKLELKSPRLELDELGIIVESSYGTEPPENIVREIKESYGTEMKDPDFTVVLRMQLERDGSVSSSFFFKDRSSVTCKLVHGDAAEELLAKLNRTPEQLRPP